MPEYSIFQINSYNRTKKCLRFVIGRVVCIFNAPERVEDLSLPVKKIHLNLLFCIFNIDAMHLLPLTVLYIL